MHRRKDGSVFPVEITSTAVFFQGEWLAFTACRDITARKDAESRLRLAASVFTHAHAGVVICNANQTILDVNPAFTRITGYGREEILGHTPRRLSSGRHGPSFFRALWQAVEAAGHWEGEIWNRRKSGESYPQLLTISSVHDPQGRLTHYIGVFTDISHFKEQQEQLEFLAHHDALTRLPNRALLSDRLAQALAHARRAGTVVAVCFMDLDGFKAVNDQHGHAAGDALLTELARRLRQGLREGDTAARLGGDEFVLLLTGLHDATECDQVLTRLLRAVAEPFELRGGVCSVSASVGVAVFPDDGSDPDLLLRHADHAMYRAKQSGKNQFALYDAVKDR
jgi:diguanylate cyclase (GGDEF)-like protein/PAS domain S-box-containing protein